MPVRDKTPQQLAALAGSRTEAGVRIDGVGDPVANLVAAIEQLGQSAAHWLQVKPDDNGAGSTTHVRVLGGRATLDGVSGAFASQVINLAGYNNATACLWAKIDDGDIVIAHASGWPATSHLKLATITLMAGAITSITDMRAESMLVGGLPRLPVFTTAARPAAALAGRILFDSDLGKVIVDTGAAWANVDGTSL